MLHADETPVAMLDPGAGETHKAYVWAYARGEFDATPAVIYDFSTGRAARHPIEFLGRWSGTLTCDDYAGYNAVLKLHGRVEAGCLAHARRKFDELAKAGASEVAKQALQRIAWLYRIEQELAIMTSAERLEGRRRRSAPLWNELHAWLRLERARVPDGGGIAAAIGWHRAVGLLEGRAGALARTSQPPHRRSAAASLESTRRQPWGAMKNIEALIADRGVRWAPRAGCWNTCWSPTGRTARCAR